MSDPTRTEIAEALTEIAIAMIERRSTETESGMIVAGSHAEVVIFRGAEALDSGLVGAELAVRAMQKAVRFFDGLVKEPSPRTGAEAIQNREKLIEMAAEIAGDLIAMMALLDLANREQRTEAKRMDAELGFDGIEFE